MSSEPKQSHRRAWSQQDDHTMVALFPTTHNQALADLLGRSESAISNRANILGLHKTPEYVRQHARFQPGQQVWNKGLKGWQAGGRSAETRFKPRAPHESLNYKPVGSVRLNSKDGYLERKVNDTHPVPARRWVGVHRLVWEAANGPVPKGHVVRFKPGQFTAVEADITLDRLECISRSDNMLRNSVHTNYPPELARLVQLKGAINRQVNRIKQTQGAA